MEASEGSTEMPGPATSLNADYIEEMHARWKADPSSVDESWAYFFAGFELAMCPRDCVAAEQARDQSRVASLIYAYRDQGHLAAWTNPLADPPRSHPALALGQFGFTGEDLDRVFDVGHLAGPPRMTLREIIEVLQETYCRTIGVEYLHIQDRTMRRWLQSEMEPIRNRPRFSPEKRREILKLLIEAERFETFTHARYPGQKRFSIEGAESVIPAIHELVELAPQLGVEEIVIGMSHRGRLNVLANILDMPYEAIFTDFEGNFLPESVAGDGDVKYHRGYSVVHRGRDGAEVRVSLAANPSHLEAVYPVVLGKARAKQRQREDTEERRKVLPFVIHGDAAFAGQGIVAETLNLSRLPGYRTGGTVHLVINNQIGFTTSPEEGRSTLYPTDVAKMIEAPIFHVNGDDPEAVVHVMELALRFRQRFARDVVVDLVCYRRHGHNEADEPAFTQPLLYRKIKDRPSIRVLYTRELLAQGVLSEAEAEALAAEMQERLQRAFQEVKEENPPISVEPIEEPWRPLMAPYDRRPVETGVSREVLLEVTRALTTIPPGFHLNPKIARQLSRRAEAVQAGAEVDWAFAEALAFGTLLREGTPVRLSGQDSIRGTFSQRHALWRDMDTQEEYMPLAHVHPGQARFCAYNSPLSEAAVLGFEYGYTLGEPEMLIIWEAQFGDFANGAQVIIDQFIVSSESKWQRTSGLVMLLPHGYEGQGPEHSNAYLERYLAATAELNIQVCNLTTPAQYFHVLRRQMRRPFRRPLIIMAPKSLLRHKRVRSPVDELIRGRFQPVLQDPEPPATARRVLLAAGKVFYDLLEHRERTGVKDVALVRIEELYPFPDEELGAVLEPFGQGAELVWVQEESRNRGAWMHVRDHLARLYPERELRYVGRPPSASPATGSLTVHRREQRELVERAFA